MNPRDRDILKDLDDTPTYGAVGVPGRIPGQLATKAMPGYDAYLAQIQAEKDNAAAMLQRQRLAAQSADVTQMQQMRLNPANDGSGGGSTAALDTEPVLRKRDVCPLKKAVSHPTHPHHQLEKRGNWLMGGAFAVAGGLLGYVQSATQFPTDRDEEKDKRKAEMKKAAEEQQQAQMQAQGGMPGDPSGMGAGAGGAAAGGGGYADASTYAGAAGGGGYAPATGAGGLSLGGGGVVMAHH